MWKALGGALGSVIPGVGTVTGTIVGGAADAIFGGGGSPGPSDPAPPWIRGGVDFGAGRPSAPVGSRRGNRSGSRGLPGWVLPASAALGGMALVYLIAK